MNPRCNMCSRRCKEIAVFCSKKCQEKWEKQYQKLIQWDKEHPNPSWEQCDERQLIVAQCKENTF